MKNTYEWYFTLIYYCTILCTVDDAMWVSLVIRRISHVSYRGYLTRLMLKSMLNDLLRSFEDKPLERLS